jgi:hypothetical protein
MRRTLALVAVAIAVAAAAPIAALASPGAGAEKWAVVIGIDHFEGRTRPNVGAVGDAQDFRDMLLRTGWRSDHVLVLTDANATQAGMRAAFRWLASKATASSYSVVHYSGHVKQMNGHEYLWPHDNRFIADTEFGQAMRAVRGWAWVDVSGCEAAGFDEGISARNRLFTASSRANEKSYEYPSWRNSVYTGLLADQGVLQRQADYNRDGRISVTEAFRYAWERARAITARQSCGPQNPSAAGADGTVWYLAAPAPAPPARQVSPAPPPAAPPESGTPPRRCTPLCIG